LRKGPIRDYIKLLFWEDKLRSHPYYVRAAKNAITIYIQLYDNPRLANNQPELDNLNDAERKKAAKKARKAAKKAEEQNSAQNDPKDVRKDDDPKGELLVKTEKPLEEAVRFLKPLQELSPTLLETHLLAFDVHYRRGT
jgi:N-alpha-acetyltransferase 15/16, NatA auxiliary subunit